MPAEHRTIPLDAIAQRTKLPLDGVEFLLMKVKWGKWWWCVCVCVVVVCVCVWGGS